MKKRLLTALVAIMFFGATAQNIQLHYDLGEDRGYLTSTVEMFKPDKWGTTFFFIDMDYSINEDLEGVNLAYFELARTFKLMDSPFSLHAEYNGGLFQVTPAITVNIENAWLGGVDYSWNAEDFSKGYSLKALYKNIQGKHDASFQFTGFWYYNFAGNKLSFTGFVDYWREDRDLNFDGVAGKWVLITEPQLWYNASENFAIGTEIELSNNFIAEEFKVMPTAGLKWTF